MSFFPDFVIAYHKISIEKFSYFMTLAISIVCV